MGKTRKGTFDQGPGVCKAHFVFWSLQSWCRQDGQTGCQDTFRLLTFHVCLGESDHILGLPFLSLGWVTVYGGSERL
jgi:hypothetical protein